MRNLSSKTVAVAIVTLVVCLFLQSSVSAATTPGDTGGSSCPGGQVLLNPKDPKSCGCPPGSTLTTTDKINCCPVDQLKVEGSVSSCGATNCTEFLENGCNPKSCDSIDSGGAFACIATKYINPLITVLSAIVGVVVAGAIIYGGIEFTTSGGDPQRAASGKKHIASALIGLAMYLFLYTFLQFILPGGLLNQ